MSDSSDWIFYKNRKEWDDVTPVKQNDGPNPVVQIAYSEKFVDVYDYFRAILKADERSERAFKLTADAIDLNPANYTVWHFRRVLLKSLNKNLEDELDYISEQIEQNPKNYQVWYHRRMVVDWMHDPSKELEFTADIMSQDAKNYHAWQHRQWVIREFNLWEHEFDFIEELLVEDIRNNSAWNQRFFVVENFLQFNEDILTQEIEYTQNKINKAPNNESPWNYLRGILQKYGRLNFGNVRSYCESMYERNVRSPYLLGFLIDLCEEHLENHGKDSAVLNKALAICEELMYNYDQIRKKYWKHIASQLEFHYT